MRGFALVANHVSTHMCTVFVMQTPKSRVSEVAQDEIKMISTRQSAKQALCPRKRVCQVAARAIVIFSGQSDMYSDKAAMKNNKCSTTSDRNVINDQLVPMTTALSAVFGGQAKHEHTERGGPRELVEYEHKASEAAA